MHEKASIMIDYYFATDRVLMERIGETIRRYRIGAQMTQKQLAQQAAVSLSSVASLEKGGNCSLLTIIQVLRTLRSLNLLEPFFREEELSPIAYAEAMKKQRTPKRVRKITNHQSQITNHNSEW